MLPRASTFIPFVFCLAGCGGGTEQLPVVPASGTVKLGALPLDGATLVFAPQDGKHVGTALSGAGGAFAVSMNNQTGALPGTYKVIVTKTVVTPPKLDPSGHEETPETSKLLTPKKYSALETTDLQVTIPAEGASNLELVLENQ